MGFWASGDQDPYPSSGTMVPGSDAWTKAKEREKSWSEQMSVSDREKGKLTPEYDKSRAAIMALYDARKKLGGPAAVTASHAGYTAPSGAGAGVQGDAFKMYDTAAGGGGPSVAGSIAGQGVDDALRARLSATAGVRPGMNATLAGGAAGGAASGAMQSAAVQAALAKAREVQAAQSGMGAVSTAMRAGDISDASSANKVALANAGMDQSVSLANQDAQMKWYAMSDAEKNALLGMAAGLDQNEMQNELNYYNFRHGIADRERAQSMADKMRQDAQYAQWVSGIGGAAGYGAQAWAANQNKDGWGSYREDLSR